jgi:hypothetical protein
MFDKLFPINFIIDQFFITITAINENTLVIDTCFQQYSEFRIFSFQICCVLEINALKIKNCEKNVFDFFLIF